MSNMVTMFRQLEKLREQAHLQEKPTVDMSVLLAPFSEEERAQCMEVLERIASKYPENTLDQCSDEELEELERWARLLEERKS